MVDDVLRVDQKAVLLHHDGGSVARPLLLVLHGLGSNGAQMEKVTKLVPFADAHGFSVAFPDGDSAPPTAQPTPTPSDLPTPTVPPTPTLPPTNVPSPSPVATEPQPQPAEPQPEPTEPQPTSSAQALQRQLAVRGLNEVTPLAEGSGPGGSWNAGTACCSGDTVDDVTYLRHVVTAIEARTRVDRRRVYVVGLSNGGMMALRAVCEAPDVFAAAGSVSGPYLGTTCRRPVWLHLHGGRDPFLPFTGGTPPGVPGLGVPVDWCLCSFPSSATEVRRFGVFVSVRLVPNGLHSWPSAHDGTWNLDGNAALWNYVSLFHL